jgi:5-oxoprolinase (ATP-hydrolysing)
MTNTRLTDPEVIERRYPVRVLEFSIRRGSGGRQEPDPRRDQGERASHRGGDGVIRKLEFLRPLRVSILSERRGPHAPFGLKGGSNGALGQNTLERSGTGQVEDLGGKVQISVGPGDILTIATPGGGAFGSAG